MRRDELGALLGAVVCACSPASAPPAVDVGLEIPRLDGGTAAPAKGIRFGRTPYRVGERWMTSVRAESVLDDDAGASQISAYVSAFRVEVLAVEGPAPTRLRVTFDKNAVESRGSELPTSIDGKTYVVEAHGAAVSYEDGSAALPEEKQRVLDVFPDLGTRTRLDEVLPDDPMEIGDAHDEVANAVLRILHPRAWSSEKGTASLVRVEKDVAVFRASITASNATGMTIDVSGEVNVRLSDARLAGFLLEGTYGGGGLGQTGRFSVRRVVRPL